MGKLVGSKVRYLLLCTLLLALPSLAAAQSVTLQPNQGPVGTGVTANGTGWPPGTGVLIYIESQLIGGPVTTDASGAFTTTFCMPDSQPGIYPVFFTNGRENFNPPFTITAGTAVTCQSSSGLPDLSPTAILYDPADLIPGNVVFFDSGVQNTGGQGSGVFNVRWFVDGESLGYGSHEGVPANSTVLDGNSQFSWVATAGTHTITFAVDVDNHVVESNESNNSTFVTVTVTSQTAQAPVITLLGDNPLLYTQGCPFVGAGATANDPEDGDLTNSIIITGSVDIDAPGQYFLTYSVTDSSGLSDVKTRQVVVFGVIGTPGCFVGKPAGKAPNLVVLVHGCCTDANDVRTEWESFGKLIAENIHAAAPEQWEIVVWDWTTQCPSEPNGECTPKHDYEDPLFGCPECIVNDALRAYSNAGLQAADLNTAISPHSYRYIHMIGHSAGARLIDMAAKNLVDLYNNLPSVKDRPFIHLTFLDAFRPPPFEDYGNLEDYPDHYAEHYVDKTPFSCALFTDADLRDAFNFDITDWLFEKDGRDCGHQWPRIWYARTVEFPGYGGPYGYLLSLEGGYKESLSTLATRFRPGDSCKLTDGLVQCGTP